ncbi:ubiquitin-protein transferase [Aureococcus anophagefferens]|nr:ubiquitin-protein transferase [Aureococcus anophagefferens]
MVALLLEAGAENTAARKGRDAAWVAARAGHADVLRLLAKHVDDLDRASSDGTTAVAEAARAGHVDALRVLVAAGADVYKNTNGSTPLALAAQAGRAGAVELLLDAEGAEERDVDVAARNGRTVVHIAALNGHADVLRAMSKHGGDVDRADANGVTPLAVAAQEGHVDALRVLIDAGADVNSASEDGSTPLRVATKNGLEEVIALLVDAGAVEPASASAARVEPERGDAKIVAVLARLGLTDLLPLFQAEEIEDRDFVALVAGDLREMGVGEAAAARILAARDEKDVADELLCPISCEVMTDPVSADDGHTYERACIEAWFAKGKRTSPATNELLESLKLRPNHVVRRMVAKYLAERA